MTAKLLYDLRGVQTLSKLPLCRVTSLSTNRVNFINKRNAHSTIDPTDLFQVNPKEVKTFWDPEGIFKSLHTFNYIRVPYIRDGLVDVEPGQKLSTCLKGKKILDVGCGAGLLTEGLAKFGADITGLDASKDLIELARHHSSKNTRLANNMPKYVLSTIEEHCSNYPDTYDAIVCSEVIEHVTEKELFVESCVRATKPGGKLFFTTPTRTLFAQFYIIFVFENILRCYPKGAHQREKFMRPNELQHMLEINNCSVESLKGYFYHPLGNYWNWTNTKIFSFAIEAASLRQLDLSLLSELWSLSEAMASWRRQLERGPRLRPAPPPPPPPHYLRT